MSRQYPDAAYAPGGPMFRHFMPALLSLSALLLFSGSARAQAALTDDAAAQNGMAAELNLSAGSNVYLRARPGVRSERTATSRRPKATTGPSSRREATTGRSPASAPTARSR
jgi:hypothetical protein